MPERAKHNNVNIIILEMAANVFLFLNVFKSLNVYITIATKTGMRSKNIGLIISKFTNFYWLRKH